MISIDRTATMAPWAQHLAREAKTPVFPKLPATTRPYLLAATLFVAANALMYAGDSALLRNGLPWALVSLLLVVAAAALWGVRAALLVLALSIVYGTIVAPPIPMPSVPKAPPIGQIVVLRSAMLAACGIVTIYLTYRARQMQERAEITREVVQALQSMILPERLAQAPGYDLCGVYHPAHSEEEVGGDLYDFFPIEPGIFGIMIGDVMGKGKEAATSTSFLRYSVRAFAGMGIRPARIMARLNHLIDVQEPQFQMASLFFGILDTRSGSLRYANAGHQPPLLRYVSGREAELESTGPVLGTRLDLTYEENEIMLNTGDALLLMTDGVTEARDSERLFLGSSGVRQLLRTALDAPSTQEALNTLDSALASYISTGPRDDIAMLLLRRWPVA